MSKNKRRFSCARNQVEFIDKCPECDSEKLYFDDKRAELICRDCGFVVSEQVPVIEAKYNAKAKKVLVNRKEKKMAVVLKGILRSNFERAMKPFYAEIKKMDLNKQVEAGVIKICQKCVKKRLTLRASKLEILCAATYIVSKRQGIPVFFDDFELTYGVNRVKILRAYRKICRALDIKMKPVSNTSAYIIRICNDLGVSGKLASVAIQASKVKSTDNPIMLAAASIYVAAGVMKVPLRQKDVARNSRISEPALRENVDKLINNIDLLELKKFAEELDR